MKTVRHTAVCSLFSVVMLGAAFAQHVETDFDHQAKFSQYKTYSGRKSVYERLRPRPTLRPQESGDGES